MTDSVVQSDDMTFNPIHFPDKGDSEAKGPGLGDRCEVFTGRHSSACGSGQRLLGIERSLGKRMGSQVMLADPHCADLPRLDQPIDSARRNAQVAGCLANGDQVLPHALVSPILSEAPHMQSVSGTSGA